MLLNPPTVAGWAQGRAWITPGTLLARGNFAREVLLPDMIDFVDPNLLPDAQTRQVNRRILSGMDITTAPPASASPAAKRKLTWTRTWHGAKAMANLLSDQEEFNTHYASLKGWEEAVRKIKPILRAPAQFSLTDMVFAERAKTTADAIDLLLRRFLACRSTTKRAPRRSRSSTSSSAPATLCVPAAILRNRCGWLCT